MVERKRPWSLLSSHGLVLVTVARFGDLAVPEICTKTSLSRSTVLHALKDLRNARMLKARRVGRRNTYRIQGSAHLRHPRHRAQRPAENLSPRASARSLAARRPI